MCKTCDDAQRAILNNSGEPATEAVAVAFAKEIGIKNAQLKCKTYIVKQGEAFELKLKAYGVVVVWLNNSGDVLKVSRHRGTFEGFASMAGASGQVLRVGGVVTERKMRKRVKMGLKHYLTMDLVRTTTRLSRFDLSLEVKNKESVFAIFQILKHKKGGI
jgi:hypothetical protein